MFQGPSINMLRKTFILAVGLSITFSAFGYFIWHSPVILSDSSFIILSKAEKKEISSRVETINRLKEKAYRAKDFVDEQGFDVSYCFLVDMRMPSGKNRFFVYNLLKDSVEAAGLVTHGKGSEKGSNDLFFSNTPNSNCTSLGKYKIGNAYNGNFGLSYKLMGLEKSNSKAFGRSVVLHSYCGVPKDEVYPNSICTSEGCPTVSPEFLIQLKTFIDQSQEPILLWIYY